MKKHIFGLTLFSFIVGAAATLYSMFSVDNIEEIFVKTGNENYSTTESCWKMKQKSKQTNDQFIKVRQAVLNLATGELNLDLATSENDVPIALHFFSKDGNETRYLTTEKIYDNFSEKLRLKNADVFRKITKRTIRGETVANLYIIAEFDSQLLSKDYQPKFNSAQAAAVILDYREVCYLQVR